MLKRKRKSESEESGGMNGRGKQQKKEGSKQASKQARMGREDERSVIFSTLSPSIEKTTIVEMEQQG